MYHVFHDEYRMYMHLYFVFGFKCLLGYLVSFFGKNCSDNQCLVGKFDD